MAELSTQLTVDGSVLRRKATGQKLMQRTIAVPDGIRTLDAGVFQDSPHLTSVMLPDTLVIIRADAFRNCSELQSVVLPNGLMQIEAGAFAGCSKLKSIVLPEGLNTLGDRAFAGCSSLKSFKVPASVRILGRFPLFGSNSITECSLPEHLRVSGVSDREVLGLPSQDGWLRWQGELFGYEGSAKRISVPPGITHIQEGALDRRGLVVQSLPQSIVSIASNACFAGGRGEELLPAGYFQTLERLPAKQTLEFLRRRIERLGPDIADLTALWLYQRGMLQTAAVRLLQRWPAAEVGAEIARQLGRSQRHQALGLAYAGVFWLLHQEELPPDVLRATLGAAAGPGDQLPEAIANAILGECGIGAWQAAFGEVRYANGRGLAPASRVKAAVAGYLAYGLSVRNGFEADHSALPRDAEQFLQQLDGASLESAAERIFAQLSTDKNPEQLLPLLRMGGETVAAEQIRQQQQRCLGMDAEECAKEAVCRCFREGIITSGTDTAMQWALRQRTLPCQQQTSSPTRPPEVFTQYLERQQQTGGRTSAVPKTLDFASGALRSYWATDGRLISWLEWADDGFQVRSLTGSGSSRSAPKLPKTEQGLQSIIAADLLQANTYQMLARDWVERFFRESYRTGAGISPEVFTDLLQNPVFASALRGIVWAQKGKLFQVQGSGVADDLGNVVSLRPEEPVYAAHPLEMTAPELVRWRKAAVSGPEALWREQLYGPVYTKEMLHKDRFGGSMLKPGDPASQDPWLAWVTSRAKPEEAIQLGGGIRVNVRHALPGGTLQLGKLEPGEITRESNHALHMLDEATYTERVMKGDLSIAGYLALIDPLEAKVRAGRILVTGSPRLKMAVQKVCEQRHLPIEPRM